MTPGSHGSTFGGNPLAMSVGNAVLDLILKKGFFKNVQLVAHYFHNQLLKLQSEFPSIIREVRGVGLLIGIKVSPDLNTFIKKLLDNKLLTIRAAENVVRLLPPLNVKKKNIDQAIVILRKVCKTF
jgi:acetylornithine/N-succinyldiaminopimelate aminotransferase